jgi:hypothetical protein
MQPPSTAQIGGTPQSSVLNEIQYMSGYFILLFLVLVCVYVSRIPESYLQMIRKRWVQVGCFLTIIVLTVQYGYVHGILAALAFSLVLSHALRTTQEGLLDYTSISSPVMFLDDTGITSIPSGHRWFGEKILGENPRLIHEKNVSTSSIQDLSERTMGSGYSNFSK